MSKASKNTPVINPLTASALPVDYFNDFNICSGIVDLLETAWQVADRATRH